MFLESITSGSICALHKFTGNGQETEEKERWGRVTFLTPDAAEKAVELKGANFRGSLLKLVPVWNTYGGDHKLFSFPAVRAKVYWPRRISKGFGILKCDIEDVACIIDDLSNLLIGGKFVRCEAGRRSFDSVMVSRLDIELSDTEILDILRSATNKRILDFFLMRGDAFDEPPCDTCEEALVLLLYSCIHSHDPN